MRTQRELLVRATASRHNLSMTQVAREMGFRRPAALYRLLAAREPRPASLERIRLWLLRYGTNLSLAELEWPVHQRPPRPSPK